MAITWQQDEESKVYLGPSVQQQDSIASFASSDYPTSGYPVAASAFGMTRLRDLWEGARESGPALGVVWEYDKVNKKLQAFWTGASTSGKLAEVANGTDFSSTTVRFIANGF